MLRYVLLLCVGLVSMSCQNKCQNEPMSRYHDDGRIKPSIALTPIINSTPCEVSWSLSDELTSLLNKCLTSRNTLYIPTEDKSFHLQESESPFGTDISWVKSSYPTDEFVVFVELIEHEHVAIKGNKKASQFPPLGISSNLNMSARIRIIDNRGSSPKIVLQEIVKDTYFVPQNLLPTDYSRIIWGVEEYESTPMAAAHMHLAKEISERIADYVFLSAKNG